MGLSFSVSDWSKLPDEILLRIFSFLSQYDCVHMSLVSKRFYNIYHDKALWRTYTVSSDLPELVIKRHGQDFQELIYNNQPGTLFNYELLSQVNSLLSLCTNVTKLDLEGNLMIQTLCFVVNMTNLSELNISECYFLDLTELKHLYGHKNLKILKLRNRRLPEHTDQKSMF